MPALRSCRGHAAQALVLALAVCGGASWRTSGKLPAKSEYAVFVGKFCFDFAQTPPAGIFNVTVETPGRGDEAPAEDELFLVIFDDEEQHWEQARPRWDTLTCDERFDLASEVFAIHMKKGRFKAQIKINEKIRPRWWFFSVVACGRQSREELTYTLHAVNPRQGYEREFSMDELGSVRLHTFTMWAFGALLFLLLTSARLGFGPGFLRVRPLLAVLLSILSLSAAGGFFLMVHSRVFARDGNGIDFIGILGDTFAAFAKVQLSLLQLFVARGHDFLQAPTEFARRVATRGFAAVFILTTVACEIYGRYFGDLDWSTSLYFYSSWPGTIILLMNSALLAEVIRSTVLLFNDQKASVEVKQFYQRTAAVAFLYFLVLPVMVVLAQSFHPWVRKKYVQRAEVYLRLATCALLCCCLWPSRLDTVINARLQSSDTREAAVEMAEQFRVRSSSDAPEGQAPSH